MSDVALQFKPNAPLAARVSVIQYCRANGWETVGQRVGWARLRKAGENVTHLRHLLTGEHNDRRPLLACNHIESITEAR